MTETDILALAKEVFEKAAAATPRPWISANDIVYPEDRRTPIVLMAGMFHKQTKWANAAYIVASANAAPTLAAEVIRQAAEIAMLKDMMANTAGFDFVAKDAEIAALRAVLDMAGRCIRHIDWQRDYSNDNRYCVWCGNEMSIDHAPNCPRQSTLAAIDALEEVK